MVHLSSRKKRIKRNIPINYSWTYILWISYLNNKILKIFCIFRVINITFCFLIKIYFVLYTKLDIRFIVKYFDNILIYYGLRILNINAIQEILQIIIFLRFFLIYNNKTIDFHKRKKDLFFFFIFNNITIFASFHSYRKYIIRKQFWKKLRTKLLILFQ